MQAPRSHDRAREPLAPLVVKGGDAKPIGFHGFVPPRPPPPMVLARLLVHLWSWFKVQALVLWDLLRGADSTQQRARRLRSVLQSMSPATIKAAQQLAMRLDVLPLEVAAELSKLDDTAPPMDIDYVVERIEAAVGTPLSMTFDRLDPEPIRSNSIACIHHAVLLSGKHVAVKVRRPDAALELSAERGALAIMMRLASAFRPKYAEVLRHIVDELPQLLFENLDFRRVARLQRLFRKQRASLRYVDAARVYMKLCSDDVIVSQFVTGVWLEEVIAAQESGDEEALAYLASMNIDPAKCGRRLLHIGWWSFFESLFLCQLPDPAHIVVRPRSRLVFIDLADTGVMGWNHKKLLMSALERLAHHDVETGVAHLVQLLLPLPFIDAHEFAKRVETEMWTRVFAMENKATPWWERAGTGMWLALLDTARRYGVSVRLDISRMIQASCMYDHMAARLWPGMRIPREFKRYMRRSYPRNARRVMRGLRRSSGRRQGGFAAAMDQQTELARRLTMMLENSVEDLPLQYLAMTKKGAYSASQTVRGLLTLAELAALGVALRAAYLWATGQPVVPWDVVRWVVMHPAAIIALLVVFAATARRILFRLDDVDHDNG